MDPEKQKQIVGYFIEEASDHLNTIESSLVDLQATLADPEMMNELFRAAHSIKGGAAMLGFTGMQHVAHQLEDSFKVLKDYPESKVEQDLQSLLLNGVDTLKELLQQLQTPSESSDLIAQEILTGAEPLFAQLKVRISALVPLIATNLDRSSEEARARVMVFRSDVPAKLRVMLQLFKQPDRPTSRQQLQIICDHLFQMGEQFELEAWCDLIQAVKVVISSSNNSYRTLAPIVIKEVKQAQEAVISEQAIVISPQLKALISQPVTGIYEDEISNIFGKSVSSTSESSWHKLGDRLQWRVNNEWVTKLNFSLSSAPEGHLPAPIWLAGWQEPHHQIEDQLEKLMTKVEQCLG